MIRNYSATDRLISAFDQGLRSVFSAAATASEDEASASHPGTESPAVSLREPQRRHAAGLMRVNHAGEVAAQALYLGQSVLARSPETRSQLLHAADEETHHLHWCQARLDELHARPSALSPAWYGASFGIGLIAGLAGDKASLGFVGETERQVEAHLGEHLERLPAQDLRSRRILEQMQEDEARHGREAEQAGGQRPPIIIRQLMAGVAGIMKAIAYRL